MDGGCRNLEALRFLADLLRRACFAFLILDFGIEAEGFRLAAIYCAFAAIFWSRGEDLNCWMKLRLE